MHKQLTENWGKLCKCAYQPVAELTELNIKILGNWPNNIASLEEAIDYTKKVNNIWIKAIEQTNEIVDDMIRG